MATDNPTFLRAHPADWLRIAIPIVLLTITYSADLFLLELAMLLQLGLAVLWLLVNVFSVIDQKKRPAWAYVPATLDLVTTTLLVYATGATSSPFAFLYVVYAAISSLNLEARQGLFSTVLAIACYGSTSTLTYMGVLNPINIIGEFATLGLAGVLTSCLVFAMVIGLTHYIISDLIRNNYEARRKLELASKQMNADLDMVAVRDPDRAVLVVQSDAANAPTLVVPVCGRILPAGETADPYACPPPFTVPAGQRLDDLCDR